MLSGKKILFCRRKNSVNFSTYTTPLAVPLTLSIPLVSWLRKEGSQRFQQEMATTRRDISSWYSHFLIDFFSFWAYWNFITALSFWVYSISCCMHNSKFTRELDDVIQCYLMWVIYSMFAWISFMLGIFNREIQLMNISRQN